ncbi:LuxR C-terminal-related transcriptional regulator [Sedimentitalea todarodis]|uniref:LuxR C-terminal-related transcriptional regulator n=1 Tax=Sedimentitalea todarodis TaxID=1631240 RepID=A0ABU3VN63_9RHOB|nr:LuxR C-terminal-related transcriptional regulator [Sedimentitalea todarodis]MDU9007124.1 LuxR C-terminal-related transcriptional regulator [Sedimentitalea todarodis]
MGTIEDRFNNASGMFGSKLLQDFFDSFAETMTVSLDCDHGRQIVTSANVGPSRNDSATVSARRAAGPLTVTPVDLSASELASLRSRIPDPPQLPKPPNWHAFQCRFGSGATDILAFRDLDDPDEAEAFLGRVWPGLRHACVNASGQTSPDISSDAMLWMISQKVNAAILVLDEKYRVLRTNAAADELLAERQLLRDSGDRLVCATHKETIALQAAIDESYARAGKGGIEFILILRGKSGTAHVPMSLSTYVQVETGERLILVMLPRPPAHERIEELARSMGLTPSEARVAALIREGHSNREAAEIAGLKIETFNTYAKRALSKMNVKCRAEMAQMLTWQAALERS